MVTMGVFPFQGKTHMVEPGIEPGTSWLIVRSSEHQATRLATNKFNIQEFYALPALYLCVLYLSENKQQLVPLTA